MSYYNYGAIGKEQHYKSLYDFTVKMATVRTIRIYGDKLMKKIDMNTWDRKEIYDFFSKVSHPFYMVSFVTDVTELKAFTMRHACSFYYALIFLCGKAMSRVENFRYICQGEDVYVIDERKPSFTDRKAGSELFHIVTVPLDEDILSFCQSAKEASRRQDSFIDITQESFQLAYFSCFPTLRLTALTNEFDVLAPDFSSDSIPRIAWGKYSEHNGRLELTISVEVNHRFIDGIHIEKFASCLERMIAELSER